MPLDFPSSPTLNQTYNFGGKTWVWNGTGWRLQYTTSSTDTITAAAFVPAGSTVPVNGVYLPSANTVAISSNTTERLRITSTGQICIATTSTTNNADLQLWNTNNNWGAISRVVYAAATFGTSVSSGYGINTSLHTATSGIISDVIHYIATQGTFNTVPTNQYGYIASQGLTGATNNYGFYSNIPSGTGRWNFYANSTADSYFASNNFIFANGGTEKARVDSSGRLGIGTSAPQHSCQITAGSNFGAVLKISDSVSNSTGILALGDGGTTQLATGIWRGAANSVATAGNTLNVQGESIQFMSGAGVFGSTTERARIDSSGRLLVGTSTATNNIRLDEKLALVSTGAGNIGGISLVNYGGTGPTASPVIDFSRSKGTTDGSLTTVVANDRLGIIVFRGADGTSFVDSAYLEAYVEGTVATGKVGSRLVFSTTADGASSPTERMRINASGEVNIGHTSSSYSAANRGLLSINGSSGSLIDFQQGAASKGYIYCNGTDIDFINAATGALKFGTSNVEKMRLDSSGRLLVGTSSARSNFFNTTGSALLQVEGTTETTSSASLTRCSADLGGPVLSLNKSRGSSVGSNTLVGGTDYLGTITFQGNDGTEFVEGASIVANVDGTPGANNLPTRLVFSTTASGAASPTERMRIRNSGQVLMGSTAESGNGLLVVRGYAATPTGVGVIDIGLGATRPTASDSTIGYIRFTSTSNTASNYSYAYILAETDGASSSDSDIPGRLVFSTTADGTGLPTEAMRINNQRELLIGTTTRTANGGVLQVSNGITFPATQSACSDANTLDDYEEGTFTPTIIGLTLPGTGTYSTQVGYYTKTGNIVNFTVHLNWSAHTGTGNMAIAGLPFASANVSVLYSTCSIYPSNLALTAGNTALAIIYSNATQIDVTQVPTGGGATATVPMDTSALIIVTGAYRV